DTEWIITVVRIAPDFIGLQIKNTQSLLCSYINLIPAILINSAYYIILYRTPGSILTVFSKPVFPRQIPIQASVHGAHPYRTICAAIETIDKIVTQARIPCFNGPESFGRLFVDIDASAIGPY